MSGGGLVSLEVLPAFLGAMAILELTPGPNMTYLAAVAAAEGRRAGLLAVAGVTAGLAFYLVLAVTSFAVTPLGRPEVLTLLRAAGAAWMLYLAWTLAARAGPEAAPGAAGAPAARLMAKGFLANVLNPKAAVFYIAVLPGFVRPGYASPAVQALTFGLMHLAISVVVHAAVVLGAGGVAARLGPGAGRRLRLVSAAALVGVAVWILLAR